MRRWFILMMILPWLVGCAATHPAVTSAPMPSEMGWSPPQVIPEEPTAPSIPRPLRKPTAAERVIPYTEGQVDGLKVPVNAPLTLLLEPGESIMKVLPQRPVSAPGEESSPWTLIDTEAETPPRPVIGITATKAGLAQGMSVMTTKRIYLVDLKSVPTSKVRLVRWDYGPAIVRAPPPPTLLPDPREPQTYYGGYTWAAMQGSTPAWMPRQVVNDQRGKTYILFPPSVTAVSAPLLRLVTRHGPERVTYRMDASGTIFILDGLFDVAELRLGQGPTAELVRITRGAPVAMSCPGEVQCPQWPAQLARW